MVFELKKNIHWVGKIDWELRHFHGNELTTNRGSSFNSYLIQDEKNVLIDTVWTPFTGELIENINKIIELNKIDFIVALHGEPDHSGALSHILSKIPDVPVYCSANGMKSLKGYYHKDWNFKVVKTGDKLNIGSKELIFIEAPMLHWPDTMTCYLTDDNILFSNDIFGQHFASEFMFDDLVDSWELNFEAIKYYANIISPFSKKAIAKIKELKEMNLKIDMICPAHGIIWRDNPSGIIDLYEKWADAYQENQVIIIYDTMYNSTRKMAESIADGIKSQNSSIEIKLFNSSNADRNDLITEIFKSKAICIGSPNINGAVLTSVSALLEEIKVLNLSYKKAMAFGSYGWSPQSIKIIKDKLTEAGLDVFGDGLKSQWNPDSEKLLECFENGKEFAKYIG